MSLALGVALLMAGSAASQFDAGLNLSLNHATAAHELFVGVTHRFQARPSRFAVT